MKVKIHTKSGRKRQLSLYMSKQRKRRKQLSKEEKISTNILPNYQHIIHSNSEESIDVINNNSSQEVHDKSGNVEEQGISDSGRDMDASDNVSNMYEASEITDINDGGEEENNSKSFKQKCIDELCNRDFVCLLLEKLDISGDLYDFINLLRLSSTGDFPTDNIVFKLLLDRIRFQTCSNTVGMRYRDVTKSFWSIVYRLCKAAGLKFFLERKIGAK